jgi:peptidoglycan/LPS O-acetylase OafA/YrhL
MIFFVSSGFLITWLLLEEYEKTSSVSLRHFYFRRSFRVFSGVLCFFGQRLSAYNW